MKKNNINRIYVDNFLRNNWKQYASTNVGSMISEKVADDIIDKFNYDVADKPTIKDIIMHFQHKIYGGM